MTTRAVWVETECGCGCGVTFQQLRDPGREREYLNNAHKQRAYRARNPHKNHSGSRAESASARARRMREEAWAREEERRENERQRSYRRRYGFDQAPPQGMPGWCTSRPAGDDPKQKRYREQAYKLMVKAMHKGTPDFEATACRERAEYLRVKYRL